MATATFIPLSEYLGHSFRPDCDYIDGELQERNLGELDHGELQLRIAKLLTMGLNEQFVRVVPELRVQVKPNHYRVPDVCVLARTAPREQIVTTPPILCIEVLSPEDRVSRLRERIRDFLDMGVPEVWLFDPATRTANIYSGTTSTEHTTGSLTVPGTDIHITLTEVFSVLDDYPV